MLNAIVTVELIGLGELALEVYLISKEKVTLSTTLLVLKPIVLISINTSGHKPLTAFDALESVQSSILVIVM